MGNNYRVSTTNVSPPPPLSEEKKIEFQILVLKWSILTEITEKYGKYLNLFGQQGGGGVPLRCQAGGLDPPSPLFWR